MLRKIIGAISALLLLLPTASMAALRPVEDSNSSITYLRGIPTVSQEIENAGVIQITPMEVDHGSLTFMVVYYNGTEDSLNFGVENISAQLGDTPIQIFTAEEMIKKAENRAAWTTVGLALLGAAATASQSNSYRYSSVMTTPRGTYTYRSTYSNPGLSGGQIATIGATGAAIYLNEENLNRTREELGQTYLQTTTIKPNEGFGGKIALKKIKKKDKDKLITITVNIGGQTYSSAFTQ